MQDQEMESKKKGCFSIMHVHSTSTEDFKQKDSINKGSINKDSEKGIKDDQGCRRTSTPGTDGL